eukprot:scaffold2211_cov65-Phaeocystis_antarctica.AAC.2
MSSSPAYEHWYGFSYIIRNRLFCSGVGCHLQGKMVLHPGRRSRLGLKPSGVPPCTTRLHSGQDAAAGDRDRGTVARPKVTIASSWGVRTKTGCTQRGKHGGKEAAPTPRHLLNLPARAQGRRVEWCLLRLYASVSVPHSCPGPGSPQPNPKLLNSSPDPKPSPNPA